MNPKTSFVAILTLSIAVVAIACNGGPGASGVPATPSPSGTPGPAPTGTPGTTPAPSTSAVTSAAQAAALVFASDPRWAQMVPLRSDMIGQSTWYEAFEDGDGFAVNITAGQGDCEAGCIDQHIWHYNVDSDGNVALTGEDGEPVDVTPGTGSADVVSVVIQLTAGPVCPVERNPPDPACAARPVTNAEVRIFDGRGNELGNGVSDADGMVSLEVPEGAYYVVPAAAEGLMGTPEAQAFSALGGDHVGLLFAYDTGIR